jgi:hypothetical protein
VVTLEFQEISNRGRKLPPAAIAFGAFLKTYIGTPSGQQVAESGAPDHKFLSAVPNYEAIRNVPSE